jgi:hypothetical protein
LLREREIEQERRLRLGRGHDHQKRQGAGDQALSWAGQTRRHSFFESSS